MFKKPSGLFIILLVLLSLQGVAQQTMLDQVDHAFVDTLISLAKQNYPRTRYFQARANSSAAVLKAQKLSWLEPVTFSYQYLPNNQVNAVQPVFLNGYQFGVFINVGSILQKPALIRKAKEDLAATTSEMQEYAINLAALVKQRYFNYLLQLNMVRVLSKNVLDAQGLVQDISIRYQKSEVSFEEFSKALVVFNGNLQSKLQAEANLLTAKSSLEELVGVKLESITTNASK